MKIFKSLLILLFSMMLVLGFATPIHKAKASDEPTKFFITNQRTGLQLHLDANNNLKGWNDDSNPSNRWYLAVTTNHHYIIINERTGLQLHMDANNNVKVYNDPTNPSNQWDLNLYNGYYTITNVRTGLQLHMDANNNFVGWNDNTNPSNHWMIDPIYYI